ncbi:cysteine hydrolase family protein [Paenibacillus mendelii]|uniref:Cysteine hydrolase family protein n=1 Tax=Paenibacillus mendelii TaxID=206163 RepID=A0ABV6JEC3_9BACL|nr:cysteine hydrolase family protein [Paenibacillus mendelii]MCQ6557143.1 cysteine hydrolase [Paenibacillus mendelii]
MMSTRSALLIIDVQVGMFDESYPVHLGDRLIEKIQSLILNVRSKGVPIFYIQHNEGPGQPLESGKPGWAIHPSISPNEEDTIIQKNRPDAFYNTTLQQELVNKGIHKLILTGIQTDICVDTTCRRANSLGYNVILVKDAHSTWNTPELTATQIINHHNNVLQWFSSVQNADEIIFE